MLCSVSVLCCSCTLTIAANEQPVFATAKRKEITLF